MAATPPAATTSAAVAAGLERLALMDSAVMKSSWSAEPRIASAMEAVDPAAFTRPRGLSRDDGKNRAEPLTPAGAPLYCRTQAPVAELVDAPDSKSGGGNIVLVRVRPGAPAFAAARLRLGGPSACARSLGREGRDGRVSRRPRLP